MRHLWKFLKALPVGHELSERHRSSDAGGFPAQNAASIEEYLALCRRRVEAGRTDIDTPQRDWIVEGNSPFALVPENPGQRRRAILMVHGLSDAPFLVRDIGHFFQQQGFYALAMQLPGHGTRPGDLLRVRWQDWAREHRHLLDLLQTGYDEIYLLGFSTGATLSIYQALLHHGIKGLFLFSPALRVSRFARLSCPLSRMGAWWHRLAWFDPQPDTDCFKYESLANRGICEAYKMLRAVERPNSLSDRAIPVFVAASENDATIDSRAILEWFSRQKGKPRRMLYYSTRRPEVPQQVKLVDAQLPHLNIKSYAHTALLQSPSNPHYGVDGSYHACAHYYHSDRPKYRACKAGREDCLGEMFDESPRCRIIRRLTYNPLFDDMLGEISAFLDELYAAQS